MSARPPDAEKVIHGIAVSAGVCRGRLFVLGRTQIEVQKRTIAAGEVPAETHRLEQALLETRKRILEVQQRIRQATGTEHADIFDAHLLVLDDPVVLGEVIRRIETDLLGAEYAYDDTTRRYATSLAQVGDPYLRERVADLEDVSSRVLQVLLGHDGTSPLQSIQEPCIVVAHDLKPSQTVHLDRHMVLGFATDVGSRTSHTAILARSLQIPALVGLGDLSQTVESGTEALLDGYSGLLVLNPGEETLYRYGQFQERRRTLDVRVRQTMREPATTRDGHQIQLSANIEEPGDVKAVLDNGAEGVGLFRTEYIFIDRETFPSEEEQYQSYRQVAEALNPAPVLIRTLDLGGDKFRSQLQMPTEMNPSLGWRAIRFCLHEKDVFRTQIRAILRSSAHGNVKMMYPMISGLQELEQATALVEECRSALRREGLPFNEQMPIGAMIETPSAAMVADLLARRLNFFSIGTNDLIQYALAVDRTNEKIAHLYEPTHPAIIRLIDRVVKAAHEQGIWVGVCGEMAGDPILVPLLLGLGVDELSAAPAVVPQIKYLIQRIDFSTAGDLAAFALGSESAGDILERCLQSLGDAVPGLLDQSLGSA